MMAITCGDCRWYEAGIGDGLPGRCRGGGVANKMWPDDAACRAMLALMETEQERDETRVENQRILKRVSAAVDAWDTDKAEVKRLARLLAVERGER